MICTVSYKQGIGDVMEKSDYLTNAVAKSHEKLKSIESRFYGLDESGELSQRQRFELAAADVHAPRKGRPRRITAWDFTLRTPKFAALSSAEKLLIEREFVKELRFPVTHTAWHTHHDGTADLHILALNSDTHGKSIKTTSDPRMRLKIIAVADRLHDEINGARKGLNHIPTVKEVRHRIKLDLGLEPIEEMIARKAHAQGLSNWSEIYPTIPKWIEEEGHQITRLNRKSISILYRDRRKPKRHRWDFLKNDVTKALSLKKGQPSTKATPEIPKAIPILPSVTLPPVEAFPVKPRDPDIAVADFLAHTLQGPLFLHLRCAVGLLNDVRRIFDADSSGERAFSTIAMGLHAMAHSSSPEDREKHSRSFIAHLAEGIKAVQALEKGDLRPLGQLASQALSDSWRTAALLIPELIHTAPQILHDFNSWAGINQGSMNSFSSTPCFDLAPTEAEFESLTAREDKILRETGRYRILLGLGHEPSVAMGIMRREETERISIAKMNQETLRELYAAETRARENLRLQEISAKRRRGGPGQSDDKQR